MLFQLTDNGLVFEKRILLPGTTAAATDFLGLLLGISGSFCPCTA